MDHVVALLFEGAVVSHGARLVHGLRPAGLAQPSNLVELELGGVVLLVARALLAEFQTRPHLQVIVGPVADHFNDVLVLAPDVVIERLVFNIAVNAALHHRRAIIVLDETSPPRFVHEALAARLVLLESLLPEILNRVVVRISEEVVEVLLDCVVFQLVHEARAVAFHLLSGRDREENNLREFLLRKRSEHTTA